MQQYVYGNIGHKGYAYYSSAAEFFEDPKRKQGMRTAIRYNVNSKHGELFPSEHQCFWKVTSDLGDRNEPERLFLQASGGDEYRTSFYVHGYFRESRGEPYPYGPELLKLINARFFTFDQAEDLCQSGLLSELQELPTENIPAMELKEDTLKAILYELLQGKKVMLQLPWVGREAMEQSRALIQAIYRRLPYEQRKKIDFLTGAVAADILDSDNPLPAGTKLILLDGDADVAGLRSGSSQVFWRLDAVPGVTVAPVYKKLMDFLTRDSQETLDAFFVYCRELTNKTPNLEQYTFFLDCYRGSSESVTDGEIRNWAANLYGGALEDPVKKVLFQKLTKVLTVERLEEYLGTYAVSLKALNTFGIPDKNEKTQVVGGGLGRKDTVQDIHAALTLAMAEAMLPDYPEGSRERLQETLKKQFVDAIEREYPCLTEAQPCATTIQELAEIKTNGKDKPSQEIASYLKYSVPEIVEADRKRVEEEYSRQKLEQRSRGEEIIASWPGFWGAHGLKELYGELKTKCYLAKEFLAEKAPGSWNSQIACRMADAFSRVDMKTQTDYENVLCWLKLDLNIFQKKGGELSAKERQTLDEIQSRLEQVLALWKTPCDSPKRLLDFYAQMDKLKMPPEMVRERKDAFVRELVDIGTDPRQLADSAQDLCRLSQDPEEQKRMQTVVASCGSLHVISEDMNFQQAVSRGELVLQLSQARLCQPVVDFQPGNTQQEVVAFLKRLKKWKTDTFTEPFISNQSETKRWLVRNLPQNRSLMLSLALGDPSLGKAVLVPIATSEDSINAEVIEKLYLAGWPRRTLAEGAGERASDTWKQAVEACFPFWHWQPKSDPKAKVNGRKPGLAQRLLPPILLGLFGVMSGGLLLLCQMGIWSALSMMAVTVIAGSMLLATLGCLLASFMVSGKAEKQMLRQLALALLPGVILAVVAVIL